MKILVTGSSGFLGSIIKKHLEQIYEVFGLCRSIKCYYRFNLSEEAPIFENNFELVIHAAGMAHKVPKNERDINEFFHSNCSGTKNLLQGLENNILPKKFVYISSVSVYGLTEGNYINETIPLNAKDPYGMSKIESEKIIINWCKRHNIICTILRLPLIVGPNPPGNLGSMISGIKKGFYFNISKGNARKSIVLASDIANYVLQASEVGGIYNLTDGYHPTINELSIYISKQFRNSKIPNIPYFFAKILAKFGDLIGARFPINSSKLIKITSTLTFDDSKAKKMFGWNPNPVIREFKLFFLFIILYS